MECFRGHGSRRVGRQVEIPFVLCTGILVPNFGVHIYQFCWNIFFTHARVEAYMPSCILLSFSLRSRAQRHNGRQRAFSVADDGCPITHAKSKEKPSHQPLSGEWSPSVICSLFVMSCSHSSRGKLSFEIGITTRSFSSSQRKNADGHSSVVRMSDAPSRCRHYGPAPTRGLAQIFSSDLGLLYTLSKARQQDTAVGGLDLLGAIQDKPSLYCSTSFNSKQPENGLFFLLPAR